MQWSKSTVLATEIELKCEVAEILKVEVYHNCTQLQNLIKCTWLIYNTGMIVQYNSKSLYYT